MNLFIVFEKVKRSVNQSNITGNIRERRLQSDL